MHILLVTPLYPPDIAEPAPYVKELARRLSGTHRITILAYNHIPEAVPGVRIIAVEKRHATPIRLWSFYRALRNLAREADIVYAQNGPSVELPLLALSYTLRTPIFIRLGDLVPLRQAASRAMERWLTVHTARRARRVIVHEADHATTSPITAAVSANTLAVMERPLPRPEILPLTDTPRDAFEAYERSWNEHVSALSTLFSL